MQKIQYVAVYIRKKEVIPIPIIRFQAKFFNNLMYYYYTCILRTGAYKFRFKFTNGLNIINIFLLVQGNILNIGMNVHFSSQKLKGIIHIFYSFKKSSGLKCIKQTFWDYITNLNKIIEILDILLQFL